LKRLEKRIKSGKLTKSSINSRGYNCRGEIEVNIDYRKFEEDAERVYHQYEIAQ
jgi:hypothetical protein